MRYLFGLLCVCALALLPALGCGSGGPDGCHAPLDDYCQESDCPTYEEAVAEAKEYALQFCDWISKRGGVGKCGDLQYVLQNTGTGTGSIQYFDDSGTLVAIRKYTDTPSYCRDTSFDLWYGPVLDCELEPGEDFCDEGQ